MKLSDLRVKIYADAGEMSTAQELLARRYIKGLTCNPSLCRKAGVKDYAGFGKELAKAETAKPISFEVIADDLPGMKRQALLISSWGENVYVKLPITNSKGLTTLSLATELALEGVRLNITALLSSGQVLDALRALPAHNGLILSVFAGRVSDTGINAYELMNWIAKGMRAMGVKNTQLLWASTREVFNIIEADQAGCDIITVPADILGKAERLLGYDLDKLSLETVQMFERDAREAGYTL